MGYSTSGAFALLMVAALVAAGTFFTAVDNAYENVKGAESDMHDLDRSRENTEINITNATTVGGGDVNVTVTNNGTTTLHVDETVVLIDNEFQNDSMIQETSVDGDTGTNLWAPGETLVVTTNPNDIGTAGRAVVITEYEVEDSAPIS